MAGVIEIVSMDEHSTGHACVLVNLGTSTMQWLETWSWLCTARGYLLKACKVHELGTRFNEDVDLQTCAITSCTRTLMKSYGV